jgi:hypothetical protein
MEGEFFRGYKCFYIFTGATKKKKKCLEMVKHASALREATVDVECFRGIKINNRTMQTSTFFWFRNFSADYRDSTSAHCNICQ